MPNPTDVLEPLFEVFERATERLAEDRRTRWHETSYGPKPRERGRPSEVFLRLALGEVSLDDFLLLKIERALTPLRKLLDEDDVAILRVLLREQCDSAPVLTSLVHRIQLHRGRRTKDGAEPREEGTGDQVRDAMRDELGEQEKRALQRAAAEGIRSALIEYVRACEEKAPELLAAIEFLGLEIARLDGREGASGPAE